jgi:hypothetical protein
MTLTLAARYPSILWRAQVSVHYPHNHHTPQTPMGQAQVKIPPTSLGQASPRGGHKINKRVASTLPLREEHAGEGSCWGGLMIGNRHPDNKHKMESSFFRKHCGKLVEKKWEIGDRLGRVGAIIVDNSNLFVES